MSNSIEKSGLLFLRNISSFLLIIILFFNIFGYQVYFTMLQNSVRKEIKSRIREGINEADLTIIVISDDNRKEITWIKPLKEFTFHGNLYDVVRVSDKEGKIIYSCINDTRESKLLKDFASKSESGNKARKLLSNISLNFIYENCSFFLFNNSTAHIYKPSSFMIVSKSIETSDPPPKHLL
jgi:hypothetical protein